jgi:hypothetical protein
MELVETGRIISKILSIESDLESKKESLERELT